MGLLTFFKSKQEEMPAGPLPEEMHGRAAQITDPSGYGWKVMWEALKTEPPADDPDTLTQELGLDQERELTTGAGPGWYATEFRGTRHGRQVALRMGTIPGFTRKGYNEVDLTVPVAPFRLHTVDGRPAVESGGIPELEGVLATLPPAPEVWRGLEVEAGPKGILARRPVTAHPRGYLYDLWLIERLADALGA